MEALVLRTPPKKPLAIEVVRGGVHATVNTQVGRWRPSRERAAASVDSLVHRLPPAGDVRLSSADREPGDPILRQRLLQLYEEIQQLLKENEQ